MKLAHKININTQGDVYVRVPSGNKNQNYKQMKYSTKSKLAALLLCILAILPFGSNAQKPAGATVIQGVVTASADGSQLIGVNITELDVNNRVVSGTISDVNGHYVLRVKDLKNRIAVSYIGFNKEIKAIGANRTINFSLKDNSHSLKDIVVQGKKKNLQGGFSVPTKEIGTAMQTIDAKDFEGLQVSSVDEALQGRVAGLDIVANSGDPGSGTSMRIRGASSINGSNEPLIVVNNVPFEASTNGMDLQNSNQEQIANMLSINPDDILEITVLKDAAASAIWGSKGANGVLMITTKKGISGPTKVDYTYRFTRTVQPKGLNMLNGSDFTMLMKQAYLNPKLDENANNINEYNYNPNFPDYENFNNDVDWVKAVTQVGNINDHYVSLSGGGERATFRVSGGFFRQNGTVIGQKLDRVSSRAYLEYAVSDRIKFISEFSFTNSDNQRSYQNILGIAYNKMPNVSIYAQDSYGNNTDVYYNIPTSSSLNYKQRDLPNPVALARLATNRLKSTRVLPTFRLQYDLTNPNKQLLRYNAYVSFDIGNNTTTTFLPQEATNQKWNGGSANRSTEDVSEAMTVYTDNNIAWQPSFTNKDHSLLLYGSFQAHFGNSTYQGKNSYANTSTYAIDPSDGGYYGGAYTGHGPWRSMAYMGRGHYAYKERYVIDGTLRRDGTTRFGENYKWGTFPGVSAKWIISGESFMKPTHNWLSMLAIRPAWGISGNQPDKEFLHFSRYGTYGSYLDMGAVRPVNLQLKELRWEKTTSFNYGLDLGLFNDKYLFDINFYKKTTDDLLFKDVQISSASGFTTIPYINGGRMNNDGWEVNFNGYKLIKTKNFGFDFKFNLSNYKNTLMELEDILLKSKNQEFDYNNGTYLTRIQIGNSFGSIYGFRYKGVYQYDKFIAGSHENAPVARDDKGNVLTDQDGNPRPIYFAYGKTSQYKFRGGDAIYEDVNHDGSIDELDIVYLGNSNPKINGGFGSTLSYKNFSCTVLFNFRYGNKIINAARMNAENMYYDYNQSAAVNWRWRKDGDVTEIPRALHEYGKNWLGSDRFVEDGSFLRFKYMTFNYSVPNKKLKPFGLTRLSMYLTFNNLYVWTKYTGVDPEVNYGSLGISTDGANTPRSKDLTFGTTIGF